jgi:hypothetical protein
MRRRVAEIRAAAQLATRMVLDRVPPCDEPWHRWRPDPASSAADLLGDWASEPLSPSPWTDPAPSTGAPHVPAVRAVHAESGRQARGAHA